MKKEKIVRIIKVIALVILSLVIIIFLLFVIPFLINVFFQYRAPLRWLEATWGSGDLLSFYGSVLTGILAILGVFWTVQYSKKQYKEDSHNGVLPYIAVNIMQKETEIDMIRYFLQSEGLLDAEDCKKDEEDDQNQEDDEIVKYREYLLDKIYFILKGDKIEIKKGLNKTQKNLVKSSRILLKNKKSESKSVTQADIMFAPILLENVGNGPAISFRLGLHKANESYEDGEYILPIHLKREQTFYVGIYCEDASPIIGKKFKFRMVYENLYGKEYMQEHDLKIEDKGIIKIDLGRNQIELN